MRRFLLGAVLAVAFAGAVHVWQHNVELSVFVGAMVAITVWTRAVDLLLEAAFGGGFRD